MTIHDCKSDARTCLKTRKLRAFRITLCIAAFAFLSGAAAFFLPQVFSEGTKNDLLLLAVQTALCLICVGLLGSMRQGRAAWLYCSACGVEPSAMQFYYWMQKGRGFRAAMLHIEIKIRKAIWTILLSAPGAATLACSVLFSAQQTEIMRYFTRIGGTICLGIGLFFAILIHQKYALAQILLARYPKKGVRSALRGSCFLMEDSCLPLLRMKLSFLPWILACLAIVPLVYVVPYYQQTTTCMLRNILRAHTI